MRDFALAHAVGTDPEAIAGLCSGQLGTAQGFTLGFLYATSPLADAYPKIVREMQRQTGISAWAGTVGLGICRTGGEYFEQPAVVALACRLDAGSFRVIEPVSDAAAKDAGEGGSGAAFAASVGIVHGDPRNGDIAGIIEAIARSHGTYLVGGLTSAETAYPQVAGARTSAGGASGVLLGGRGLEVSVGLTQGCSPIGPVHTVTQCDRHFVLTLDQRPAFEVLREDCGAAAGADPRRWLANVHAALPVAGSDRADYVVRNIVGIGADDGLVAIADTVRRGDRVMFVQRNPASAARDLTRMLGELKSRARTVPRAGLYFSCLARGPNLFAEEAHEMKAIQATFGDIPIAGFFGNGEIAHDRLYGYTGVLLLMS